MRAIPLVALAALFASPALGQADRSPPSEAVLQQARRTQCAARFPEYQRGHPATTKRVFMGRCLAGAFDRYGKRPR
jgi:hypothetical protein